MEVTGVVTQGSQATSSFVTSYKVQYSVNGINYYTLQENGADKVIVVGRCVAPLQIFDEYTFDCSFTLI